MSWYFFGGFSAYLMLPSGRWKNHSGCSRTQRWSGEHWIAKSSATSSPSRCAASTNRSKSSSVPRSGWTAVKPPSALPIAHGLPGSPGAATSELLRPLRCARPIDVARHQRAELRLAGQRHGLHRGDGMLDTVGVPGERAAIVAGRPLRGGPDQGDALAERAREVLATLVALLEVGEPRAEGLRQRLDRVVVPAQRLEREGARPAVVVDVAHRRLAPRALAGSPVLQIGDEHVVAVLEDVGLDLEDPPDLALDGIASAVDSGGEPLDDDGAPRRVDRPSGHGRVTGPG